MEGWDWVGLAWHRKRGEFGARLSGPVLKAERANVSPAGSAAKGPPRPTSCGPADPAAQSCRWQGPTRRAPEKLTAGLARAAQRVQSTSRALAGGREAAQRNTHRVSFALKCCIAGGGGCGAAPTRSSVSPSLRSPQGDSSQHLPEQNCAAAERPGSLQRSQPTTAPSLIIQRTGWRGEEGAAHLQLQGNGA